MPRILPGTREIEGTITPAPTASDYDVFEVDLSTARTDEALGKSGISLTILSKGTGTWSLKFNSTDKSPISSDDLRDGDLFEITFSEIYFTNTAQTGVTNPKFYIGKT